MNFKSLIGKQVSHKKFGLGNIVEITDDTYANVNFNGNVIKFAVDTLDLFFTFADQSLAKTLAEHNQQVRVQKQVFEEQRRKDLIEERLKQKEEEKRLAKEAQKERLKKQSEAKKLAQKDDIVKEKQSKPKKQKPQDCLEIKDGVLLGVGTYTEQTLKIPQTVTTIADNALKNANVTRIIIPDTITTIGKNAFDGCALKSIVMGKSIKEIHENAFANCKNITRVSFKGTVDEWSEINFHSVVSNPTIWSRCLYINNKLVTNSSITNNTKPNRIAFLGWEAQIDMGLM